VKDNHDPMCRWPDRWAPPNPGCDCDLIDKVRADEINKHLAERLNLRAKVEALHAKSARDEGYARSFATAAYQNVLNLIDGGSE